MTILAGVCIGVVWLVGALLVITRIERAARAALGGELSSQSKSLVILLGVFWVFWMPVAAASWAFESLFHTGR